MDIEPGQTTTYLYRKRGQEIRVEATIVSIDGKQITIEFTSPQDGQRLRRVLRGARERGRLVDLPMSRPGASVGNQNAVKSGPKRVGLNISLSRQRLHRMFCVLDKEHKEKTPRELRQMVYRALDEHLSKH